MIRNYETERSQNHYCLLDIGRMMRSPERGMIVVTHYQRLLGYVVPDFVHVMADGRIVKSGGKELALELEEKGYDWILKK